MTELLDLFAGMLIDEHESAGTIRSASVAEQQTLLILSDELIPKPIHIAVQRHQFRIGKNDMLYAVGILQDKPNRITVELIVEFRPVPKLGFVATDGFIHGWLGLAFALSAEEAGGADDSEHDEEIAHDRNINARSYNLFREFPPSPIKEREKICSFHHIADQLLLCAECFDSGIIRVPLLED